MKFRKFPPVCCLLSLLLLFSGCWGEHELNSLFIITGIALDTADDPEMLNITFQAAKTQSTPGGPDSGSGDKGDPIVLLHTQQSTVSEGISEFDHCSGRKIFIQHNQVLLIGSALAEKGINEVLDLFMRNQEARLEVAVVVVEGEGAEVLSTKMPQEQISGMFVAHVMERQSRVSVEYRTRLIDLVSRIVDETSSPVVPLARVEGMQEHEGDGDRIHISGMAIFKDGRMVGKLGEAEARAYTWATGRVRECTVAVSDDTGRAVFNIDTMDSTRKLTLRPDGRVAVKLSVEGTLSANELHGFGELEITELIDHLTALAERGIREGIENLFEITRQLRTDIFEYGVMAMRKYPREWRERMEGNWDAYFFDIAFEVDVKVRVSGTGKVTKTLNMREQSDED